MRAPLFFPPETPKLGAHVFIGNVDGVHKGHVEVLRRVRVLADAAGCPNAVLSFWPHPAEVLGRGAPPLLSTLERRAELIDRAAGAALWVRAFDVEFSKLSAEEFVERVLVDGLQVSGVSVGADFRFGRGRTGDLQTLKKIGAARGFSVHGHELVGDDTGSFSSSRVRAALAAGDIAAATRVLGRPHVLGGVVVKGDQLGRTIGFPTANLSNIPEMLPAHGVYAVIVECVASNGTERVVTPLAHGVMNVGTRPTVNGQSLRVEVHLFDWEGDLYDSYLRVGLVARLRGEQKFDGLPALRAQIEKDGSLARDYCSRVFAKMGPWL